MVLLESKVTLGHVKMLFCDLDMMPSDTLTTKDKEVLQKANQHLLQKLQDGNMSGALQPSCLKHAYIITFILSIFLFLCVGKVSDEY